MCGIFGFSGPPDPVLLAAMAARLRHRGPDEEGMWSGERLSLGVTRLAIVDVAHGQQPLVSEDGTIVLAFNGEVYNHRALRAGLERRGHRFATGSDGEVVVHLYEEEGEAALERLAGMFALALWDARRGRLLLARDGFGMKTVCYTEHEGRFAFASEVKGLLCLPDLPRRLDTEALATMATHASAPPTRTLFAGVRQLAAGHLLLWRQGAAPEVRPFWRPRVGAGIDGDDEQLADELERRLLAAVESHLASEVPMGATLSGGVDSSLLVAMASRLLDRPLPTYTVSFPGDFDERPQARLVAEHCHTAHHEIVPEGVDILRLLPHLLWCVEEPDRGPLLAHELLFARAAEDVRVLLMGEGSDELFGGYPRMKTAAGAAAWLPSSAGRAAYLLAQRGTARAASDGPLREVTAAVAANGSLREVFRHYGTARGEALLAYEQAERLPSTHVLRMDRMAMAHSLETRLPFLDRDVAELANRLPLRLKTRWRGEKRLLRDVARRWLPAAIAERPKLGLRTPPGPWLRAGYLDLAEELLAPANVAARGCFAPRTIDRLLRRLRRGARRPFDVMHLHFFVLLEGWHRVFIDPPVVRRPADDLLLPTGRAA